MMTTTNTSTSEGRNDASGNWPRSVWAIVAGLLVIVIVSSATDALLYGTGFYPPMGTGMPASMWLIATVYRTIYGIAGCYVAARLAPSRPMRHAMILGVIGFIISVVGAATMRGKPQLYGPIWYPITLVLVTLPSAWLGGWLYTRNK
jgi:uncharacterized membrane protein HdeD (DUF308 family)